MSVYINNQGSIELDKELTSHDLSDVLTVLRESGKKSDDLTEILTESLGGNEIIFEDYYEPALEDYVEIIANTLTKLGYEVNGVIEYYGDYDGKIFVEGDEVTVLDVADCWRKTAPIEEIIEVLKQRGWEEI